MITCFHRSQLHRNNAAKDGGKNINDEGNAGINTAENPDGSSADASNTASDKSSGSSNDYTVAIMSAIVALLVVLVIVLVVYHRRTAVPSERRESEISVGFSLVTVGSNLDMENSIPTATSALPVAIVLGQEEGETAWKNYMEKTNINIFLDKLSSDEKNLKQCSGFHFIVDK